MPHINPHIPNSHPTPILQDFHYDPNSIINSLYAPNLPTAPIGEIFSPILPIDPTNLSLYNTNIWNKSNTKSILHNSINHGTIN